MTSAGTLLVVQLRERLGILGWEQSAVIVVPAF